MVDGAAAAVPHAANGGSGSRNNGLDKKDQKYDRQLRLWGARGQKALMESHILLINAGAWVGGWVVGLAWTSAFLS